MRIKNSKNIKHITYSNVITCSPYNLYMAPPINFYQYANYVSAFISIVLYTALWIRMKLLKAPILNGHGNNGFAF